MTTPTGTISLSDVNIEFGFSSTALISLNDGVVRSLAGIPSGTISMDNLRGKNLGVPVTFISNSAYIQTTSGSSWSQPVPSGATGDLLVFIVNFMSVGAFMTIPSGWTQVINDGAFAIFSKYATSASESNFTATQDRNITGRTTSVVLRYRDASSTVYLGTRLLFNYNATGSVNPPGVPNTTPNDNLLALAFFRNPSVSITTPSGWTAFGFNDSDANSPSSFFFSKNFPRSELLFSGSFTQPNSNIALSIQLRIAQKATVAPTVTSINPSTAAEGETIVITGSNFIDVTGVSVGGTAVTNYTVTNPTTISAVLPARAAGNGLSVVVTNSAGASAGNSLLTYIVRTYTQVSGITYTVSSTYSSNSPPTYQYMNDNNANGSTNGNQWGSNQGVGQFIAADLGSNKNVGRVIIGYDYLNNLPGGWGVSYTAGLEVQTSTDNSTWTTRATTPTYASSGSTNGLVTINFAGVTARYVRLRQPNNNFMATLEFQIWTVT